MQNTASLSHFRACVLAATAIAGCALPHFAHAALTDADNTYGSGGSSSLNYGADRDTFLDFAAGASDKTYVLGRDDGNGSLQNYVLRRLGANGMVDTSFGSSGSVLVTTAQPFGTRFSTVYVDETAQRIYLGGSSCSGSTCMLTTGRYNYAGQPDTSWGANGLVQTSIVGGAYKMLRQADGKLVGLTGNSSEGSGFCSSDPAVFRLTASGAPDSGFGSNGRAVFDFGSPYDVPVNLAIDADGKLLVSGFTGTNNCAPQNPALIRVLPNGNIDTGFASNGLYTANFGGTSETGFLPVAQAGGKVAMAYLSINQPVTGSSSTMLGILRLSSTGVPDTSFGTNGRQSQTFSLPSAVSSSYTPGLVQSTGKLLLAGSSADVLVYRYSGSADLVGVTTAPPASTGGTTTGGTTGSGSSGSTTGTGGSGSATTGGMVAAPVATATSGTSSASGGGGALSSLSLLMLLGAGWRKRGMRVR